MKNSLDALQSTIKEAIALTKSASGKLSKQINFEDHAILLLSDARGIYIPRDFANEVLPECMEGMTKENLETLQAGPDHEWYWEAWEEVCNNVIVTEPDTGIRYYVWQDGDCFLVPEGVETPEW